MTDEEPMINKSCGIIPNRPCLVIFAVLKIVADLIACVTLGYISLLLAVYSYDSTVVWFLTIVFGLVLDIPFMILLIVGSCKKSNHLYKISFHYSIISLVIALSYIFVLTFIIYATELFDVGKDLYSADLSDIENFLIHVAIVTAYTLIHVYMILLMKSEITKSASIGHVYNEHESIKKEKRSNQLSYDRFV